MTVLDVAIPTAESVWGVGDTGQVCHSGDAGRTWTQAPVSNTPLGAITAIDGQRAWAAGDGGTVFRTQDGGHTWVSLPTGMSGRIQALLFTTDLEGFMVQGSGAYATADGGTTWQAIGDVSAYPRPRLAAWSSHQMLIRSRQVPRLLGLYRDGHWQHGSLESRWGQTATMDFVSATKLFAHVDDTLIVSTDGGTLWQPVTTITLNWQTVDVARVHGLLVGRSGDVMITAATAQGIGTLYSPDEGGMWQTVTPLAFRDDGPGRVFGRDQAWTFSAGNGLLHLGP